MKKAWLFSLLVILLAVSASVQAAQTQIDQAFLTDDFGLVEIKVSEQTLFSSLFSITVTPNTVKPGDRVSVVTGIEADCPAGKGFNLIVIVDAPTGISVPEGTNPGDLPFIEVHFDDVRTNFDYVFACQNSLQAQLNFDAPTFAGKYRVRYEARDAKDFNILYFTEQTIVTVVSGEVTSCGTQSRWQDWIDVGLVPSKHGKTQQRAYINVGPSPECIETLKTGIETRTLCDAGYVIENSEATMASGLKNCVLPGTTNICGNSIINTNEECDGTVISGIVSSSCTDYNYGNTASKFIGGTVTCTNTCRISLSQCTAPAGVAIIAGVGKAKGETCNLPDGSKVGQDDSTCTTECASGYCSDTTRGGELFGFDFGECSDKPTGFVCTNIIDSTGKTVSGAGAGGAGTGGCSKQKGAECTPVGEGGIGSLGDSSGPSTECKTGWCQDTTIFSGGRSTGSCADAGQFKDSFKLGFKPAEECRNTAGPQGLAAFIAFINGLTGLSTGAIYGILIIAGGLVLLRIITSFTK